MLSSALPEITGSLLGLLFAEGVLAFFSPCILPMLPVYIMYLSGNKDNVGISEVNRKTLVINTLGFILGFTIVFVVLGATASAIGRIFSSHRLLLQRISGGLMILFGLYFLGVFALPAWSGQRVGRPRLSRLDFFSSLLFGFAFSFGWTPCLGPFLGSALLFASNSETLPEGVFLLLLFSLGLGTPFLVFTLLWDRLQGAFSFMRRHLPLIKKISGILLVVVGFMMVFDVFGYYQGVFT